MHVTTIGIDLAKHVFQVHAVDASGRVLVRKALRRTQVLSFFAKLPPCLVGMEACGTSHHGARELSSLGHTEADAAAYVKAYVKRGKTDAADAEAICEPVTRPTMRFVPIKSREQQAALSMHRVRDLLAVREWPAGQNIVEFTLPSPASVIFVLSESVSVVLAMPDVGSLVVTAPARS